jgi:hypothetical protein
MRDKKVVRMGEAGSSRKNSRTFQMEAKYVTITQSHFSVFRNFHTK